ncbi:MAG TPA: hypothetical protein VFK27_06790, partial [Bacillales bacterium]|nr:hypothetical protein [Bacillales bacterium]
ATKLNGVVRQQSQSSGEVPNRSGLPIPDAVMSLFAPGTGMSNQNGERKGHDVNPSSWGFGLIPEHGNESAFSPGSVVTAETKYRTQWIHAPPSPPPKSLLLFKS